MNEKHENYQEIHPPQANLSTSIFTQKDNVVAIFTAMCILRSMKHELGIEAMHEYLDGYIHGVSKNNPKLSFAVSKALSLMSVEKMYRDACYGDKV